MKEEQIRKQAEEEARKELADEEAESKAKEISESSGGKTIVTGNKEVNIHSKA